MPGTNGRRQGLKQVGDSIEDELALREGNALGERRPRQNQRRDAVRGFCSGGLSQAHRGYILFELAQTVRHLVLVAEMREALELA